MALRTTSQPLKQRQKIFLLTTFGLFIWLCTILIAPLLISSNVPLLHRAGQYIYFFYQPICHQIPERSFYLSGGPLAVCVRCFSFYLGAFLAALFLTYFSKLKKHEIGWYMFFLVPVLTDIFLEKIGLYQNLPAVRFATGLILGLGIMHLIFLSICENRADI